jgi:hypothetical protein
MLCDQTRYGGMAGSQRAMPALFICLHEVAVTDGVGGKYDGQAPFQCSTGTWADQLGGPPAFNPDGICSNRIT